MDLVVYKRFFHISAKVTMFVIIANGGREINLPPGQYMLGRPNLTSKDQCPPDHIKIDVECNDDPKISRNHAVLCVDEDSLTIRDYGSKNGLAVREAAPGSPWLRARKQGLKPHGVSLRLETFPARNAPAASTPPPRTPRHAHAALRTPTRIRAAPT